jgi:hypothetical protein
MLDLIYILSGIDSLIALARKAIDRIAAKRRNTSRPEAHHGIH